MFTSTASKHQTKLFQRIAHRCFCSDSIQTLAQHHQEVFRHNHPRPLNFSHCRIQGQGVQSSLNFVLTAKVKCQCPSSLSIGSNTLRLHAFNNRIRPAKITAYKETKKVNNKTHELKYRRGRGAHKKQLKKSPSFFTHSWHNPPTTSTTRQSPPQHHCPPHTCVGTQIDTQWSILDHLGHASTNARTTDTVLRP